MKLNHYFIQSVSTYVIRSFLCTKELLSAVNRNYLLHLLNWMDRHSRPNYWLIFKHSLWHTYSICLQEQVNKQNYNEKSDIWSLGCLVYELCSLSPPFTALNQRSLEAKIRTGKFRPIPERYSRDLSDVVNSMLKVNVRSTRIKIHLSVFDVFIFFQILFNLYDY